MEIYTKKDIDGKIHGENYKERITWKKLHKKNYPKRITKRELRRENYIEEIIGRKLYRPEKNYTEKYRKRNTRM